jgi:nucleoside-diphosphate-sugar epimerase
MVFAETGHKTKVWRAGKPMLRFLGFFDPRIRELIEMMYQFQEPFVVEHAKFVDAFGDISTPLTEAIRETVEWYRSQETPAVRVKDEDEEPESAVEEAAQESDQKSTE